MLDQSLNIAMQTDPKVVKALFKETVDKFGEDARQSSCNLRELT